MPKKCPKHLTKQQWLIQRFWEGVLVLEEDECWPWMKATFTDGYGTITTENRIPIATHRLSYAIANGPIPKGIQILHTCDNPPCCNPKHLKAGTNIDNVQDMLNKRRGAGKLTLNEVEDIRNDRRLHRIIAAEYKISGSLVSMIKTGKRWSSLIPPDE